MENKDESEELRKKLNELEKESVEKVLRLSKSEGKLEGSDQSL